MTDQDIKYQADQCQDYLRKPWGGGFEWWLNSKGFNLTDKHKLMEIMGYKYKDETKTD